MSHPTYEELVKMRSARQALYEPNTEHLGDPNGPIASAAISLKRIADALDELNLFLKAVDAAYGPLVQR